jgi:hypothetical protein
MLVAMVMDGENRIPDMYNRTHLQYWKKRGGRLREGVSKPVAAAFQKPTVITFSMCICKF